MNKKLDYFTGIMIFIWISIIMIAWLYAAFHGIITI